MFKTFYNVKYVDFQRKLSGDTNNTKHCVYVPREKIEGRAIALSQRTWLLTTLTTISKESKAKAALATTCWYFWSMVAIADEFEWFLSSAVDLIRVIVTVEVSVTRPRLSYTFARCRTLDIAVGTVTRRCTINRYHQSTIAQSMSQSFIQHELDFNLEQGRLKPRWSTDSVLDQSINQSVN